MEGLLIQDLKKKKPIELLWFNKAFKKCQVATIGEDSKEPNDDHGIHPCPPGYVLKNWTCIERTVAFRLVLM